MKAEKAAQHSFKAKCKKRDMAAKVVQAKLTHREGPSYAPGGFRIFNCVFRVLIIQLLKTVYGALLIYVMFFLNSIISKQHFFIYYAIFLKNYMRYSYEIRHNYLK